MKRSVLKKAPARTWNDFSAAQKRGLGAGAAIQFVLLLLAFRDWLRRPAEEFRGPKLLWLPLLFINFIGPIAYLTWGRHGPVRGVIQS